MVSEEQYPITNVHFVRESPVVALIFRKLALWNCKQVWNLGCKI